MDYIKELKIALINADMAKIEELSSVAFESKDKEELQMASALISETIELLDSEKAKVLDGMRNIQKMKKYMLENKKELL
jgi:hypothetical protein